MNNNQKKNSENLRDWCISIYDFLISIDSFCSIWCEPFKAMAIDATKKGDKKKMRAIYKETNVIIREIGLSPDVKKQLNSILEEKFHKSLFDVIKNDNEKIHRIIKRGHIRNDREYELVKRREDEIYADESQKELMLKLQQLMLDYEK